MGRNCLDLEEPNVDSEGPSPKKEKEEDWLLRAPRLYWLSQRRLWICALHDLVMSSSKVYAEIIFLPVSSLEKGRTD